MSFQRFRVRWQPISLEDWMATTKDHAPPHFHAIYSGQEAQIRIDDGSVLAGFLPATAERLVKEWAVVRRAELLTNWERAQKPDALEPIEPLR